MRHALEPAFARLGPDAPPEAVLALETLARALRSLPDGVSLRFDPTLVRGMGYYTGTIFEIAHPSSGSSVGGGGRYDGMITTRNARSVDCAAGQLIARCAGAALEFAGGGLEDAPLDLGARYDVAAARTAADLRVLREAQDAVHA